MRLVLCVLLAAFGLVVHSEACRAANAVLRILLSDSPTAPLNEWTNEYDGSADTVYVRVVVDSIEGGIIRGANLRLWATALDREEGVEITSRDLSAWVRLDPEVDGLEEFADSAGYEVPAVVGEWALLLGSGVVAIVDIMPTPYDPETPMLLGEFGEVTEIRVHSAQIHYGQGRVLSYPIPPPVYLGDLEDTTAVPGKIGLWLPAELLPSDTRTALSLEDIGDEAIRAFLDSLDVVAIARPNADLHLGTGIGRIPTMPDLTSMLEIEYAADLDPPELAAQIHESFWRQITSVYPITNSGTLDAQPDDEEYQNPANPLWHLHNIEMDWVWENRPELAWLPTPSWRIGIIDSGVEFRHDEFGGGWGHKFVDGYHFGRGTPYPVTPGDCSDVPHGTRVAGALVALTNNGCLTANDDWDIASIAGGWSYGTQGVEGCDQEGPRSLGPACAIYARMSVDENNNCLGLNPPFLAGALSKASDPGDGNCKLINMSFHYQGNAAREPSRSAVAVAYKYGSLVCCSTGNQAVNGDSVFYPGFIPDHHMLMTVGGSNMDDEWSGTTFGSAVDVVAPGKQILSTDVTYSGETFVPVPGLVTQDGSSFSTPMVTGLAALVKQLEPPAYIYNFDPEDLAEIIKLGADDIHESGWDMYTGAGRINARTTLELLNPPYVFLQEEAGPEDITGWQLGYWEFRTFPGAPFGSLPVRVMPAVVEFEVTLPFEVDDEGGRFGVWPVGLRTLGLSELDPNYSEGDAKVVSVSATTATFSTMVYDIWIVTYPEGFTPWGWWPVHPSRAAVGYSLLGIPVSPSATPDASGHRSPRLTVLGSPGLHPSVVYRGSGHEERVAATLVDSSGRRVVRLTGNQGESGVVFDLPTLPAGVYYFVVGESSDRMSTKVVVTR